MMKLSYLQFLNFKEIFMLSMSCRKIRMIIGSGGHLKIIASAHLLQKDLTSIEIDNKFGLDI